MFINPGHLPEISPTNLPDDTLAAEQRVIALMAADTKSYFFATIAERDATESDLRRIQRV